MLLYFYLAKRLFLFMDEWLFYFTLYKLYTGKHYYILAIVLMYGMSCIYTSYSNIEKIEYDITGITQSIWINDIVL